MKVEQSTQRETPEQILALAEAWLGRQRQLLRQSLGERWELHREWIDAYLREEVKQRLIARGWRPAA